MDGASKTLGCTVRNIFMEYWPEGLRNAGTDPLDLLLKLQGYGFKLKFARDISNQRNTPLELGSSIELKQFCEELKGSQIFDLMLERRRA